MNVSEFHQQIRNNYQPIAPAHYVEPAVVPWFVAMDWAEQNGIRTGRRTEEEDLEATNEKRIAAGLPPFQIATQRGKTQRLPHPKIGGGEKPTSRPKPKETADV